MPVSFFTTKYEEQMALSSLRFIQDVKGLLRTHNKYNASTNPSSGIVSQESVDGGVIPNASIYTTYTDVFLT